MGKKGENQAIKELNNISIYTSSLVTKINLKKYFIAKRKCLFKEDINSTRGQKASTLQVHINL